MNPILTYKISHVLPSLLGCYKDEKGQLSQPTDIGFVVDASSSLYREGFRTEIDFINNVIDAVGPIASAGVRVSVIVYSDMAKLRIKFHDHFNSKDLMEAVDRLPYDDVGETRIDLGLEKAFDMFKVENGARGSSKKVIILCNPSFQTYSSIVRRSAFYVKKKLLFSLLLLSFVELCSKCAP